jgi:hypothetical protein
VVVLLADFREDLRAVLLDAFLRELVAIVSFHLRYEAKTAINSTGSAAVLASRVGNPSIIRALTSTIPVADVFAKAWNLRFPEVSSLVRFDELAANECESGNRA